MAFGKRRSGLSAPPGPPPTSELPPPALPGARLIAPNLIEFGKGEADPADGAARIERLLLEIYDDAHGGNAETALSAAGALAGFAAQQAIWEGCVRPGELPVTQAFTRVETTSGETYFFGSLLDMILTSTQEGHLSVWSLVAGAALKSGTQTLPALKPMIAYCAETAGTPAFGVPVLPGQLALMELPREALRHWPQVKSILLSAGIGPLQWPSEIAVAAQKLILRMHPALAADLGTLVVMQAAIPMSKVDPRTVPGGPMVD
jgi:hypothetical protein